MNKQKIIIVLITAFVVLLPFIPVKEGYSLKSYIYDNYIFRQPKYQLQPWESTENLKIQIDSIEYSEILILHDSLGAGGFEFYKNNNVWRPCNILWKGEVLKAKVKSHGRTPFGHYNRGLVSLKVKLNEGDVFGERNFRLIIYNRIREKYDQLELLADKFKLRIVPDTRINVQINNSSLYPYYFELKATSKSLRKVASNFVLLRNKEISTFVKVFQNDTTPYFDLLQKEKSNYKDVYIELNNSIEDRDTTRVWEYFDENYLISFFAASKLAAFEGHGIAPWNIVMPLDTLSGKFYPFLHRDFEVSELNSNDYLKVYNHVLGGEYLSDTVILFDLLKQKPKIEELVDEKIKSILDEDFLNQNKNILNEHLKMQITSMPFLKPFAERVGLEDPYKDDYPLELDSALLKNLSVLMK